MSKIGLQHHVQCDFEHSVYSPEFTVNSGVYKKKKKNQEAQLSINKIPLSNWMIALL